MPKIIENKILDYIKKHKIVKSREIEKYFNLTQSSARRYLIKLEEQGYINRTFGEIILKDNHSFQDQDFEKKINSNLNVKKSIAKYASKLSLGYKTVFVDSGSLCYFLLQYLDKKVELFTNSLSNAKRAIDLGFENVNILGGVIKPETKSIVEFNEEELNKIVFPISFLGVNAIDDEGNLYTPEKREAKAKNNIIKKTLITIVLAEEEKFSFKSTFKFNDDDSKIIIVSNIKNKKIENENVQIINTKD
ncbi:MAG: DeoR/GlpR transcriptional regulator [Mycoplasma sp.]|nr:DeoR/GlpR transcriptional regulator [Mycoplasma sp.]